eukprot:scaffold1706_cov113-Isochrysis_galbana.AAC.7
MADIHLGAYPRIVSMGSTAVARDPISWHLDAGRREIGGEVPARGGGCRTVPGAPPCQPVGELRYRVTANSQSDRCDRMLLLDLAPHAPMSLLFSAPPR